MVRILLGAAKVVDLTDRQMPDAQGRAVLAAYVTKLEAFRAANKAPVPRRTPPPADPLMKQKLEAAQAALVTATANLAAYLHDHGCKALNLGCFAAGTLLWTPTGWKAVEELRAGDEVYSRDEHDPAGPVEVRPVEEAFRRLGSILVLTLRHGQQIRTTPEHPFFRLAEGSRGGAGVEGEWAQAGTLKAGDRLLLASGECVALASVEDEGQDEEVYNCRVAEHHTYFVGGPGTEVWAHNAYAVITRYDTNMTRFGHWSIEVKDEVASLHTHQLGAPGTPTRIVAITAANPVPLPVAASATVEIRNAAAAMTLQHSLIAQGIRGAYDLFLLSCVSHVCEILAAAELEKLTPVPPVAGNSEQWKFLKRLLDNKIR